MTVYAGIHYACAVYSAFMAVVHLVIFFSSRRQEVHLWLAVSFVGWAITTAVLGQTSYAVDGLMTARLSLIMGLSIFPIFVGLYMTAWRVAGRKLVLWRWLLLGAATLVGLYRIIDVHVVLQARGPVTAEAILLDPTLPSAWFFWGFALVLCGVWVFEGLGTLLRRPIGWLLLLAIIPGGAMAVSDILVMVGVLDVPMMLGFAGFVFAFFASIFFAIEFIRARRRLEHGDIDRYELGRKIGAGGMGELFLAVRKGPEGFERQVALKRMLRAGNYKSEWIDRFLLEARIAASLHHPNIVAVNDLGRLEYGWFMVMEYLDGCTLADIRNYYRGRAKAVDALAPSVDRLPGAVIARIGEKVCRGLEYAHGLGVMHRDISPQNIMVTREGNVKVIDFGIAKARGHDPEAPAEEPSTSGSADLTEAGKVIGKSAYMSPDRLSGKDATEADDMFALSVVLYELTAGFRPFRHRTAGERLAAMQDGDYKPLDDVRPDLPQSLISVIHQGISARKRDRFADAKAMGSALAEVRKQLDPIDMADWMDSVFGDEATEVVDAVEGDTGPTLAQEAGDATVKRDSTQSADTAALPDPASAPPERVEADPKARDAD